jgi:hypothetical protein
MKRKRAILEYHLSKPRGRKKARWRFTFKSPEGHTLVASAATFASRRAAERGFVSMIKFIATNQYQIGGAHKSTDKSVANN